MKWWPRRVEPKPDVDRMLDESIANLEAAVAELRQQAAAYRQAAR